MGAGVESKVATLNTGGELAVCPMLDDQVMAEGFFFDADLFHLREEDGDIYFNYGAELYVAIGGGVELEVNISECWRQFCKFFFPNSKS